MKSMSNLLIRIENWCRRFSHRRGYGVHSPADFYLITSVIYEKLPFYAYQSLHQCRGPEAVGAGYREKVDKMLFRLANYLQPHTWVDDGEDNRCTARYIEAACPNMRRLSVGQVESEGTCPDLVHLGSAHYKETFSRLLPWVGNRTCFIIGAPYASKEKEQWWREVIADPRVGVTFDLYDVGLAFFDKKRCKEHRIVNFF